MRASTHAQALLRAGVPLSLLMDLLDPVGPDSRAILHAEAVAADLDFERAVVADLTRYGAAHERWHSA